MKRACINVPCLLAMLLFLPAVGAVEPAGAFTSGGRVLEQFPRTQGAAGEGERWTAFRAFRFDYASARIHATDTGKVAEIASHLRQHPTYRLALDGAAGDAPIAHLRVDSVREALIAAGIPAYKIRSGAFGDPLLRREGRVEVLFAAGR